MTDIPDVDELEDLWVAKLAAVAGVRSSFSIGELDEIEASGRVFKYPAAIPMYAGGPTDPPETLGGPVFQEGTMNWSVFIVAESMRGPRKGRSGASGTRKIAKAIQENVVGWEIKPGWRVYRVDHRPADLGEVSTAVDELLFAHQFDMRGN